MAENNGSNSNHFGSGMLIGSLIGAGAIFLLGTKKGKKLLRALTEEGLDTVSEIGGLFEGELEGDVQPRKKLTPKRIEKRVIKTINKIKKSEPVAVLQERVEQVRDSEIVANLGEQLEPVVEKVADIAEDASSIVTKKAKRFFKGIKKR